MTKDVLPVRGFDPPLAMDIHPMCTNSILRSTTSSFNCDEAADENDHNISVCVDKCCVGIIRQQCGHYEPLSSTAIPAT